MKMRFLNTLAVIAIALAVLSAGCRSSSTSTKNQPASSAAPPSQTTPGVGLVAPVKPAGTPP